MQGVFVAVVTGGPRLGDLRAGAMGAATSSTVAWAGGGLACMTVAAVGGLSVRPLRNYRVSSGPASALAAPFVRAEPAEELG
jgi:hypothetical protein